MLSALKYKNITILLFSKYMQKQHFACSIDSGVLRCIYPSNNKCEEIPQFIRTN